MVDPPSKVPYAIELCAASCSALSIGEIIRSTVKNAARLAVYDEMIISVKNHHVAPTIRVEMARGLMSEPCCISVPTENQKLLDRSKVFCTVSVSGLQGWGLYHS